MDLNATKAYKVAYPKIKKMKQLKRLQEEG
ncbi:hypothetical protein [Lacrimispora saccharolytica]|nr:hypothetical protein [Lacrimispora saccharolytica]